MKPTTKIKILLALLTAAFIAGALACRDDATGLPSSPTLHTASHTILAASPAVPDASHRPPGQSTEPVLVCVLIDYSGSVPNHNIDLPEAHEFAPVIDLLEQVGGELAVGSIFDRPSDPFLRLRLAPPETPSAPPGGGDVFTRSKRRRAYEKALPEFRRREEERRARNQVLIDAFMPQLAAFLEREPTAPATDIWSGLRRCETFLLEPPVSWTGTEKTAPARYLVAVSDGRHTVTSSLYSPLDRSIQVLAVSGVKGLGDLSQLDAVRWFESSAAAFYFINAAMGR